MDNAPQSSDQQASVAHLVTVEGCFGTILWRPPIELYSVMARADRDELLDMAGSRLLSPYFTDLARRLLHHADVTIDVAQLDCSSSLETRNCGCSCFGTIDWVLGQGFWDALPGDQRDALIEASEGMIHQFLKERIIIPLMTDAARSLGG